MCASDEVISRLARELIVDSIRHATDETDISISTICYAVQLVLGYWLCKAGSDEARAELCREIDAAWPEIKSAQLTELLQ